MNKSIPLSYVSGPTDVPLLRTSVGQRLKEITQKYPNEIAFISHFQHVQFTYQELFNICTRLAAALRKMGMKKGDRLGIYSPNNWQWFVTQFASSIADVILVNINPSYQQHELEYCLNKEVNWQG